MRGFSRFFCLLFTATLAVSSISLIMAESALAQSTPKPSEPKFTLKIVQDPFEIQPKTSIDPYTGENVTIQAGYTVQHKSIVLTIKNQHFTPYKDSKGNTINLFYNVSVKGSFESNWRHFPSLLSKLPLTASDNDNTILSFSFITSYMEPQIEKPNDPYFFKLGTIPVGGQVDFRVQALIGYYTYPLYETDFLNNVFNGETSEWSNTQTITIPATVTSTPTLAPDSTPMSSENTQLTFIAVTVAVLVAVTVSLLLYVRHLKNAK